MLPPAGQLLLFGKERTFPKTSKDHICSQISHRSINMKSGGSSHLLSLSISDDGGAIAAPPKPGNKHTHTLFKRPVCAGLISLAALSV